MKALSDLIRLDLIRGIVIWFFAVSALSLYYSNHAHVHNLISIQSIMLWNTKCDMDYGTSFKDQHIDWINDSLAVRNVPEFRHEFRK